MPPGWTVQSPWAAWVGEAGPQADLQCRRAPLTAGQKYQGCRRGSRQWLLVPEEMGDRWTDPRSKASGLGSGRYLWEVRGEEAHPGQRREAHAQSVGALPLLLLVAPQDRAARSNPGALASASRRWRAWLLALSRGGYCNLRARLQGTSKATGTSPCSVTLFCHATLKTYVHVC